MKRGYLKLVKIGVVVVAMGVIVAGCQPQSHLSGRGDSVSLPIEQRPKLEFSLSESQKKVLEGAKAQLISPAVYDASYQKLNYPGGDVAADRGACTDVVIRALRHAGYDLQELIHEDSKLRKYASIPRRDKNIDHRRCPNLIRYFSKFGTEFPIESKSKSSGRWEPGDFVFWKLDNGLDHVGVVSDQVGESGSLMVIHNISRVQEEDVLNRWKVVGHFRFPK